jgi:hypothetical protein
MPNAKKEITDKAKPEGNPDPSMAHTPDVSVDEWSAEEIAEESAYKDGTEVKEEMKDGKRVKRESRE